MKSLSQFLLLIFGCFSLTLACSESNQDSTSNTQDLIEGSVQDLFLNMSRDTKWELIHDDLLPFETFHTQGMSKWKEYYFLSSVEIIERTEPFDGISRFDRSPGEGEGHLFKFDANGDLVQSITLSEGDMYHPGGIDFGGGYIWVPVAEYRPNSSTIIYRVNPETMESEKVFQFSDHISAVIFDTGRQMLHGYTWGSRYTYSWDLEDDLTLADSEQLKAQEPQINSQLYIDYQDCQNLGNDLAICSGLSHYNSMPLGGIELIKLKTLHPIYQIPVEEFTEGINSRVMTQNPFYAERLGEKLLFHFIPEDDKSRHFIYEVSFL